MVIEKLIDVGEDLYSIEITQGIRTIAVYPLDNYRNKNILVKINIEEVAVNWIETPAN